MKTVAIERERERERLSEMSGRVRDSDRQWRRGARLVSVETHNTGGRTSEL